VLINTSATTYKKFTALNISISTKTRAVSNVTGLQMFDFDWIHRRIMVFLLPTPTGPALWAT